MLDRLEARGYVRRNRDTEDRRRVLVEMTDDARGRAMEFYGPMAEAGMRQMSAYTVEQLALVRDFLRAGRDIQETQLARLRDSGTAAA